MAKGGDEVWEGSVFSPGKCGKIAGIFVCTGQGQGEVGSVGDSG